MDVQEKNELVITKTKRKTFVFDWGERNEQIQFSSK
jgi:hypothetical protein